MTSIPCPWIGICSFSVNLEDKFVEDKLADHIADHELPSKNQWVAHVLAKTLIEKANLLKPTEDKK